MTGSSSVLPLNFQLSLRPIGSRKERIRVVGRSTRSVSKLVSSGTSALFSRLCSLGRGRGCPSRSVLRSVHLLITAHTGHTLLAQVMKVRTVHTSNFDELIPLAGLFIGVTSYKRNTTHSRTHTEAARPCHLFGGCLFRSCRGLKPIFLIHSFVAWPKKRLQTD